MRLDCVRLCKAYLKMLLEYSMTTSRLERYGNHNRVLLVFAPSAKDKNYLEQKQLLENAESGVLERDMVVSLITDLSDPLRDDYSVPEEFTVVLIGKDGTEKERFSEPVEPTSLFSIIDQMPMRRREIKERQ